MLEGRCKYRGPDGTKCAIGCLIPDEKYTPALEGKGSSSPIVRDALGLGGTEDDSLIRFLIELQQIHDSTPVESWNELLQRVALKYGLEPVETVSVDIEPTVAHTKVFNRARSLVKEAYDSSTGRAPWKVYQKASRMLREAGL